MIVRGSVLIYMEYLKTLNTNSKIHFIGIGGISMSALAQILHNKGYIISGSDTDKTKIIDNLISQKIEITNVHSEENVYNKDLIVRSAAIKDDNPEVKKARELSIPIIERSQLLGGLMKLYKNSIGVAGTHGKTTTTSMISLLLQSDDKNPTTLVGGILENIGGNFKIGGNEYFVTEACEYCNSFLDFSPTIAVILNIEEDHLDYFRDLEHIIDSFNKYAKLVPENGHVIVCADNENSLKALKDVKANIITFGIYDESAHWSAKNISKDENGKTIFDCYYMNKKIAAIKLNVYGTHNVYNALASIAAVYPLGISEISIKQGFLNYHGTDRRFQIKGTNNFTVVSDYAHHPTEIKATLEAAKQYCSNKIWCIFQPHTYSRTLSLLDDFAKSFYGANEIIITDIYAAREINDKNIHSKDLVSEICKNGKNAIYIKDFDEIQEYIKKNAGKEDLVITMGAGNIDYLSDMLIS
jgi:UDP-N-acetylmuramate--alanine ligase